MSQGPVGWRAAAFPAPVYRFNAAGNLLAHGCDGRVVRRKGGGGGEGGDSAGVCCAALSSTLPHQCGGAELRVPDWSVVEGDEGGGDE